MLKKVALYTAVAGLNKSFSVLLAPFLLIWYSADDVGSFIFFILCCTLLSPIVSLNLSAVMLQAKSEAIFDCKKFAPFFLFQLMMVLVLALTSIFDLSLVWYGHSLSVYFIGAISEALFLFSLALYRVLERSVLYALIGGGKFFSFFLFSAIFPEDNLGLPIIYIINNFIFLTPSVVFFIVKTFGRYNFDRLVFFNSDIKFGIGIFGNQISQWVANSGSRVVIGFFLGPVAVANFSIALFGALPLMLLNSGLAVYIPRLLVNDYSRHVNSRVDEKFFFIFIFALVASIFILASWDLVLKDFFYMAPEINFIQAILCCFAYFNYSVYMMFANYLFYNRASATLSKIGIMNSVVSVALCLVLVNFYALTGAAVALWLSSVMYVVLTAVAAEQFEQSLSSLRRKFCYFCFSQCLFFLIIYFVS